MSSAGRATRRKISTANTALAAAQRPTLIAQLLTPLQASGILICGDRSWQRECPSAHTPLKRSNGELTGQEHLHRLLSRQLEQATGLGRE
jgi:hypothetical protein